MAFFKKKQKDTINSIVKVNDIHVITSHIISSCKGGGGGPYYVTMYFLAKRRDNEYYELFSGKKLEKDERRFDTPCVKKAEPLKKYMKNQNKDTIDLQSLFDFITIMNVEQRLT